jgi:hypothetical protein
MLTYLFKKPKKIFGAGLSTYTCGLESAGVGIGVVFGSLIIGSPINFITGYFKESFETLTLKYVILTLKEILLKKMLTYLIKKPKKNFGAGLSTYSFGLEIAGVGIGVVFGSLIIGSSINFIIGSSKESIEPLKYVILELKEISFALSSNLDDLKLVEDNWNTKP